MVSGFWYLLMVCWVLTTVLRGWFTGEGWRCGLDVGLTCFGVSLGVG